VVGLRRRGDRRGGDGYAYARLGRIRPKASPEFQYTTLAFGPQTGFVAGWLMLVGDLAAAATVALGFGGYFQHLADGTPAMHGLVLLIVIGVPSWGERNIFDMPHGVGGVSSAATLIFFAYLGFDELGNFAEEMRNPERDVPRALFIAVGATTGIYLARPSSSPRSARLRFT
jgi:APA family basic amino acid/polyamine antiporter